MRVASGGSLRFRGAIARRRPGMERAVAGVMARRMQRPCLRLETARSTTAEQMAFGRQKTGTRLARGRQAVPNDLT